MITRYVSTSFKNFVWDTPVQPAPITIQAGDHVSVNVYQPGQTKVVVGTVREMYCLPTYPQDQQLWNLTIIEDDKALGDGGPYTRISSGHQTTLEVKEVNYHDVAYPRHCALFLNGHRMDNDDPNGWDIWYGYDDPESDDRRILRCVAFRARADGSFEIVDSLNKSYYVESRLDWLDSWYYDLHQKYGQDLLALQEGRKPIHMPDPVVNTRGVPVITSVEQAQEYIKTYYEYDGWTDAEARMSPQADLVYRRKQAADRFLATHELAGILKDPRIESEQREVDRLADLLLVMQTSNSRAKVALDLYHKLYNNDLYRAAREEGDNEIAIKFNNLLIDAALWICGHPAYTVDERWLKTLNDKALRFLAGFTL